MALHFEVETLTVFPYGVSPFFPFLCPMIMACSLLNVEILFLSPITSFSSDEIFASRSRNNDFVCLSDIATMVEEEDEPSPREEAIDWSRVLRRLKLDPRPPMPALWNTFIL